MPPGTVIAVRRRLANSVATHWLIDMQGATMSILLARHLRAVWAICEGNRDEI